MSLLYRIDARENSREGINRRANSFSSVEGIDADDPLSASLVPMNMQAVSLSDDSGGDDEMTKIFQAKEVSNSDSSNRKARVKSKERNRK